MAGDWIKMRIALCDDPRVIAISARTNIDTFGVVGRLHNLWSWADTHTRNGRCDGITSAWVDSRVSHVGFADAMASSGWLIVDDKGVTIPRFNEHNGKSAKRRASDSRSKHSRRGVRKMSAKCPQNVRTPCGQNADQRREEKRREEKNDLSVNNTIASIDRIYAAYPRQVGKEAARRAIAKAVVAISDRGEENPHLWLLNRVTLFSGSRAGRAGKFCPHPATWFNAGRYDDNQEEWDRADSGGAAKFEEQIEIKEFQP